MTTPDIEATLLSVLQTLLDEKSITDIDIRHDTLLNDELNLNSLDLARLTATCELSLRCDPFAETIPITAVKTFGDLIKAYAQCQQQQPSEIAEQSSVS